MPGRVAAAEALALAEVAASQVKPEQPTP